MWIRIGSLPLWGGFVKVGSLMWIFVKRHCRTGLKWSKRRMRMRIRMRVKLSRLGWMTRWRPSRSARIPMLIGGAISGGGPTENGKSAAVVSRSCRPGRTFRNRVYNRGSAAFEFVYEMELR
ncbi:hypothetical protein BU26DRAFT_334362 [Trematosphaeria pertusa]|uniref:Uncharacterized protein n=1 Tax=Trematosphaeria pertusa TaxID=390896 RepID=A0A6A6IE10_9PLEO|nr:uncharacterized protein BU26DRAFT_334362 [Trematosphaeria pertusa]KAF2248447.1 hypothetical protein BU26DRAFT_334362 [Trematosphaeria pertusa]